MRCTSLLADTGNSSGENYALLEQAGITAFIQSHGQYTGGLENCTYVKEWDYLLCPEGQKAALCQVIIKGNKVHYRLYKTTRLGCRACPLKANCYRKLYEKRIAITSYRDAYEHPNVRTRSRRGRRIKRLQQAMVEPFLGTR